MAKPAASASSANGSKTCTTSIKTEITKVLLQAEPWCWDFAHRTQAQLRQRPQSEAELGWATDEVKGIAANHLAEAEKVWTALVAEFHNTHRSAPGHVDVTLKKSGRTATRCGTIDKRHVKPFACEITEGENAIERRVEDGAEIFGKA
jgi:hypothetical protein